MYRLTVSYRGRELTPATVAKRLDEADPGTYVDHPLVWSCPVMAGYSAENARDVFGARYDIKIVEV